MLRSTRFTRHAASATTAASSGLSSSSNLGDGSFTTDSPAVWTSTQRMYRELMKSIRMAYVGDRAGMFWARHRIKVETYKYASVTNDEEIRLLNGIGLEVSRFMNIHMRCDPDRVMEHNRTMMKLSVEDAKKFRQRYLEKEAEHVTWCHQRIRAILDRRPTAPYPYC